MLDDGLDFCSELENFIFYFLFILREDLWYVLWLIKFLLKILVLVLQCLHFVEKLAIGLHKPRCLLIQGGHQLCWTSFVQSWRGFLIEGVSFIRKILKAELFVADFSFVLGKRLNVGNTIIIFDKRYWIRHILFIFSFLKLPMFNISLAHLNFRIFPSISLSGTNLP